MRLICTGSSEIELLNRKGFLLKAKPNLIQNKVSQAKPRLENITISRIFSIAYEEDHFVSCQHKWP